MTKPSDPVTIDFSASIVYGLYYIPFIGKEVPSPYPFAEKFYTLHRKSLRCQIYEDRSNTYF
ncbi:MAG: hypothetical protein HY861_03565 [Chlamydiia bacterium]|nr:hypothetical protein [Chlamydiia bacterium]